jgi:putative membrane-bound dehydrogenase-like protein
MPRSRLLLPALLLALPALPLAGQTPGDDDLAKELPRIAATEPDAAQKTFAILPGFRLEPIAVEPVVMDPVSVCYDADGRIYVAEMRGYPFPENSPTGHVSRLEDRDGDGTYETRSVFLEGLSWPTSVVPYDGGVFVAVAPDILYAKDTDGDGKADVRKVMFTGFGNGNVQALLNGLLWGPDGWIYGVGGGNGGDIRNLTRPDAPAVSIRGRDFRFRPDGSAFEATSGGGQFGHAFDDWGHRFTSNNSNHIRQIALPATYLERTRRYSPPAVLTDIAVEGGAGPVFRTSPPEPWRVVRTRQRVADPELVKRLAPTERFAFGFFTSATGVTIYRGMAYPEPFRGNAFVGDVGGNLVHRKVMRPAGALYEAERADAGREFLTSTDNWFRPVNFTNTPGGTLLILDMYRETIEHPASIPEPIKRHLDLKSGTNRGRLYEIVPDGFARKPAPKLSAATTPELVAGLGHPDAWWRETAQRLLIERQDAAAVAPLKDLAKSGPTPLARMHALWTLASLGAIEPGQILAGLKDAEPRVREGVARLAEGPARRDDAIAAALVALAEDADAMVRYHVALSLGGWDDPRALDALAAIARRDGGDRWTRAAVLLGAADRPLALLERLGRDPAFLASADGRGWVGELSGLVGAANDREAVAALVERFTAPGLDPSAARAGLLGLAAGLRRAGQPELGLLKGPRAESILMEAIKAATGDGPPAGRIEGLRVLAMGEVNEALGYALVGALDGRQPSEVQLAALQTLGELPDEAVVGTTLARRWTSLSPAVRNEAMEVLLARPGRVAGLLDAVAEGTVPRADIDPARRAQLLKHPREAIRTRAAEVLGDGARTARGPILAAYRGVLEREGDRAKGKEVFRRVCATCHVAEGEGKAVGPDLATITNRLPEDLLAQILDPNREVLPAYLNYTVATTDGQVYSGLIAQESPASVTLKRAEGAMDVIPRDRIDAVASTGLSLMPENLETLVEPAAMADLLAYLRSLRAP